MLSLKDFSTARHESDVGGWPYEVDLLKSMRKGACCC